MIKRALKMYIVSSRESRTISTAEIGEQEGDLRRDWRSMLGSLIYWGFGRTAG